MAESPPGVEIRHATADDIEPVCRLLVEWFRNTSIPFWRVMLSSPFLAPADKPHYGTVLCAGGVVAGFSGAMFADRLIDGRTERFGNLYGWYVRPEYRRYSVNVVAHNLKTPGVTWTIQTSRHELVPLFLRLRFRRADERKFVCYVRPGMFLRARGTRHVRVVRPDDVTEALLGAEAYRVYEDHIGRTVDRIVFEAGGTACLVVTKRIRFPAGRLGSGLQGTELYYASDRSFLQRYFDYIRFRLCMRDKVLALLADERLLGFSPKGARVLPARALFRSETLPAERIDALYSELTILP